MRITIAAVGRLKAGPERDLYDRYAARLDALARTTALGPLKLAELPESRAGSAAARKTDEAARLLSKLPASCVVVVLDEHGRAMSSEAFAELLRTRRDSGAADVAFLIGGADGHGDAALGKADVKLSLGPMTLPHGLARIVLAEQLYRAATIVAGHPYHRA
jgi:23S rRNA (pseudouridine1915-N3)-methyltransferase